MIEYGSTASLLLGWIKFKKILDSSAYRLLPPPQGKQSEDIQIEMNFGYIGDSGW